MRRYVCMAHSPAQPHHFQAALVVHVPLRGAPRELIQAAVVVRQPLPEVLRRRQLALLHNQTALQLNLAHPGPLPHACSKGNVDLEQARLTPLHYAQMSPTYIAKCDHRLGGDTEHLWMCWRNTIDNTPPTSRRRWVCCFTWWQHAACSMHTAACTPPWPSQAP